MRPERFPKVNDVMLAEALRQLMPVAEAGVRTIPTTRTVRPFRRAEAVLDMWVRQERGRRKKLDGPVPQIAKFTTETIVEVGDDGQSVPLECQRPTRRFKGPPQHLPAL